MPMLRIGEGAFVRHFLAPTHRSRAPPVSHRCRSSPRSDTGQLCLYLSAVSGSLGGVKCSVRTFSLSA